MQGIIMASKLKIYDTPKLDEPTLLMGFSGWMNGSEVSTGTIEAFVQSMSTQIIAEIESPDFYISNFPGSMDVTSIFRPHCIVSEGIIEELDEPANIFWASPENNLLLFLGQEPNIKWRDYADSVLDLCDRFDVSKIYFLGSVAGLVPHTREPRFICTVSDLKLKRKLQKVGFKFTNYEGPASISTYLITAAAEHELEMASIISEVPAYVHGRNPKCIESMARHVSGLLGLGLEFPRMRLLGDELEKRLNEVIAQRPELASHIQKIEADYDNEVFDIEMSDLKDWLHKQGIRLD